MVVAWFAIVAFQLTKASRDAGHGVDAMEDAREAATGDLASFVDSIGRPDSSRARQLDRHLTEATESFRSAHDAVGSILISPLRSVPVLGRQIRSVSALSSAAATTSSATHRTFRRLSDIASSTPSTPDGRVAAGRETQATLTAFSSAIRGLDLGPNRGLITPLTDAYNRFAAEVDHLNDTLGRALTAVTGVNRFLSGPTRYLVLAANNAEMRAGSGMFLQAGELTVDGGRFSLSPLRSTADMVLPAPGTTTAPDVARLWSWMTPDREWRSINVTPRFDENARMASDMWAASGHPPVDGVIAIDIVGLQKLLRLVGPVHVDDPALGDRTVTADDVLGELLLEQYRDAGLDNATRHDGLSDVAHAVFDSMNDRPFTAGRLLRTLQRAGQGRHLLMWSRDDVQQAGWEALGTSGTVAGDSLLVSLLNRGGNKLDQFLGVTSDMSWTTERDVRHVKVTVHVTNRTPPGLPKYVVGPYPGLGTVAGQYIGILALTVPSAAFAPTTQGADLLLSGDDGPTRVLATRVDLDAGESTSVTFSFDLPLAQREVVVQPSARVPGVEWSTPDDSWTDDAPHVVDLGS